MARRHVPQILHFYFSSPNAYEDGSRYWIGADAVVDYTCQDVLESGPCDVFFDVVPNRSFRNCARILSPIGVYVTTLPGLGPLMWKVVSTVGGLFGFQKKCGWLMIKPNRNDLEFLNNLIEDGMLRPVVESTNTIDEFRSAHQQSETGHTRGKIVLRIAR